MKNIEFIEKLKILLEEHKIVEVRELLEGLHPADIAELMDELNPEDILLMFRFLKKSDAAEVFSYLSLSNQIKLLDIITTEQAARIVDQLYSDDAVNFLEEVPANLVTKILVHTSKEKRDLLNKFLSYKEDSAGSAMTEEYLKVLPNMTVGESLNRIRNQKNKIASSSQIYVVSERKNLVGVLSIGELLRAEDNMLIKDIMTENVISCHTDTDQEEALQIIQKYDFMALPVTDSENRLVGIITSDDFLDIAQEEASDDISIMAAIHPSEKSYFETTIKEQAKNRLPWLAFLTISGMINGLILSNFEEAFVIMPILVTFIPMLTDTGGNTGAQSSTLVIRGLALGEIEVSDAFKIIFKEFKIALIVGLCLGALAFFRVMIFPPNDPMIGLLVGISILIIVLLSQLCGSVLPILAEKIGLDPALMAAPLITTIVDAGGLVVFFLLAKLFFNI